MILGAHVSIAGGFDKCLDRIHEMGGNCLQTFASSPRSLQTSKILQETIDLYLKKKSEFKIGPHFFHGVYLVNLATESKSYLKASMDSLIYYQKLAGQIEGVGTIFHVGHHKGLDFSQTLDQIVSSINYILDSSPKGIKLILENAAGNINTVGSSFEQLKDIISRIGDKSKIGVCLDTQHCFANGLDLTKALDKFDQVLNLKYLTAVHLNDSKTDFASKLDRHENLTEGKIGQDTLEKFLNDPRLKNIPIILEVPGDGNSGPRKQDLDTLKELISS